MENNDDSFKNCKRDRLKYAVGVDSSIKAYPTWHVFNDDLANTKQTNYPPIKIHALFFHKICSGWLWFLLGLWRGHSYVGQNLYPLQG